MPHIISAAGQDPSNIAVSGGTIAGVTIDGIASSLIGADIAGLALFYARAITAANYLKSKVSALTKFERIKPGKDDTGTSGNGASTATTNDAAVDGGGITSANSTYRGFGATIIQNPKTTKWGLYFRATLIGASGGYIGLVHSITASHGIQIGRDTSVNTKWQLYVSDGTSVRVDSTVVADDSEHDFYLYFDLATLTLEVDGVVVATQASLTRMPTDSQVIFSWNQTAGGAVVKEIVYGV